MMMDRNVAEMPEVSLKELIDSQGIQPEQPFEIVKASLHRTGGSMESIDSYLPITVIHEQIR